MISWVPALPSLLKRKKKKKQDQKTDHINMELTKNNINSLGYNSLASVMIERDLDHVDILQKITILIDYVNQTG